MSATTVLIAHQDGEIIGEYTFRPVAETHAARHAASQAMYAAASLIECEHGYKTTRVVLFDAKGEEYNAAKLEAARLSIAVNA